MPKSKVVAELVSGGLSVHSDSVQEETTRSTRPAHPWESGNTQQSTLTSTHAVNVNHKLVFVGNAGASFERGNGTFHQRTAVSRNTRTGWAVCGSNGDEFDTGAGKIRVEDAQLFADIAGRGDRARGGATDDPVNFNS